ncbi:hypothetical protein D3C87_125890 [compost metagenome]
MRVVGLESYELEIIEVHLKQTEYETKVVQLVKAFLEIDRAWEQQLDQASDQCMASEMKEAA